MNNEAIQLRENQDSLVPADVTPMDLQSALAGDISRLTPEGRLKFYGAICQTVGLNPLTKPFDWLTLQGKTVLYANKGCAEQLRKIHGVTVEIIERKVEFGCLIVRVKATSKDGRSDEAIGAVPFNQHAAGEAAAIAMMKCETKAKRRVTLSICGLGLLDESELDSVRGQKSEIVSAMNGEESAESRAEKFNQQLTGGEKSKAVDVEIVPPAQRVETVGSVSGEKPEPRTQSQPEFTGDGVPNAGNANSEMQAGTGEPSAESATRVNATLPQSSLSASKPAAPSSTLSEDLTNNVEIVLSERDATHTRQCVGYLIAQGQLQKGQGLEHLKQTYAEKILKYPKRFHDAVDAWKRTRSQS